MNEHIKNIQRERNKYEAFRENAYENLTYSESEEDKEKYKGQCKYYSEAFKALENLERFLRGEIK